MPRAVAARGTVPRTLLFRWALWFSCANALGLMLISLNYLKTMSLPRSPLAQLFLGLSLPGNCFSLALYLFPVVALAILLYPRRRFVFGLAGVLQLILVLLVIVDSLVFSQYRFHLNGMVWNLLTSGAAGDVLPVTGKLWVILGGAVLFLGLLQWAVAAGTWRWVTARRRRYGAAAAVAILLLVLGGHGMHAWANANQLSEITNQVRYLPGYKPLTAKKLMVKLGLAVKNAGPSLNSGGGNSALRYPLEPVSCTGGKKNLVLIVIDSWRFDCLTPQVTPNIFRFAQENIRFDNHFSSGNCTRFGIFGMFYGVDGTYWHSVLTEEKSPVLMRELEQESYRMGIFASAPLTNPEFDRTVFSDLRTKIALRQEGEKPYQRDRAITDKMLRFLGEQRKGTPFFGFLFYDAPHAEDHPEGHTPFKPALKEVDHLALNNGFDPAPYFNKYRNSLNYVDGMVQEVLGALAAKGLLDSTVVIVTGDHGQEFNDLKQNYWGHNGNFSRYQVQTPLVVHWPGKAPGSYAHATSHLDLAPTLMHELLGCRTDPGKYSNGRYLFDTTPRPYVLVSSWDTFGIVEPDRTTVSLHAGEVDILDRSYRPIPGAAIRPEVTRSAMEGIGRFFAR